MAHYLIDGYNLLHAGGILEDSARPLEEQRDHLCQCLQQFARKGRHRVTVVFDGQGKGLQLKCSYRNVSVLFSPTHREADEVIQHHIRQAKDPAMLVVVSSDREITHTARAHGARVLTSPAFARSLHTLSRPTAGNQPPGEEKKKYDPTLSAAELQEWLKLFNSSPDEEDKRE